MPKIDRQAIYERYRSPVALNALLSRVDAAGDCWIWRGLLTPKGYGRFRGIFAHRLIYALLVELIPADLTVDHLCRVRACVNPDHMELVPGRTNTLRGYGVGMLNKRVTHCPASHRYDTENTYVDSRGRRNCRVCNRAAVAAYKARTRRPTP